MSKITINVLSRISGDKNFFLDILYAVFLIKEKSNINLHVKFIGNIYDYNIYTMLERFAVISEIKDQVFFTKKSIPISEINTSDFDYFLSFSIGDFIGYSGVETIKNKFKTLFYNVDPSIKEVKYNSLISLDIKELQKVFYQIVVNKNQYDLLLQRESDLLLEELKFDKSTENKLLQILD